MKKRIALTVCALILIVGSLSACKRPNPTKAVSRWDDGESYTFNVTLADFETADGSSATFKSYPLQLKNEDGTEKTVNCFKDSVVQMTTAVPAAGGADTETLLMRSADEIRPVAVKGTYTFKLSSASANAKKLETEQKIYAQYETETLKELGCLETLSKRIVSAGDNPFTNSVGRTTLLSKTQTSVVFNDADQSPISSTAQNEGYYIGRKNQSVSQYKTETTYNSDKGTVSVKRDGGEAKESKLGANTLCIDSAQLLLYARSLDKTSAGFQDSPSVLVYDSVTDTRHTATFALNREFNALLNNGGKDLYAKVNCVSVSVDNRPFLTQYNLPDLTKAGANEKGLDFRPMGADGKTCKFSAVKFRSGWFSYELNEYSQEIVDAIKLK